MDFKDLLNNHQNWLKNRNSGIRADFSNIDLRGVDFRNANLQYALFRKADLRFANLSGANLRGTDFEEADLRDASLTWADLQLANLRRCNLHKTQISGANLYGAHLENVLNINTIICRIPAAFYSLQCPEFGAYIGYKHAGGLIVKLEIPSDALRTSATSRKCRASKVKVLSITDVDGNPAENSIKSDYDSNFVYTVGETVEVDNFETDRWQECAPGIHHYITREEAVMDIW